MAKRKNKVMPFFKYLTLVMGILAIITLGLVKFIDILPVEYFYVLLVVVLLVGVFNACLILNKKSSRRRVIGTITTIVYIIILVLVIVYLLNTIGFLKKLGFNNYKTENYSVIVLKSRGYNELKDIKNKDVGSLEFNNEGLKKAKEKLEKKVDISFKTVNDASSLRNNLLDGVVEAILIENSVLAIMAEDDNIFNTSTEVIYEFSLEIETPDITKDVDITKDSFNIYISGIDTYGVISSVSRSDVNMILSINPQEHKILIASIPRDYYIKLASKKEYDKLTHAGIYGIEESVKSLEEFLDIKINYYIKLNFTSMINVVDAIGGVKVYSKYNFTSRDNFHYNAGYNNLKGEEALSFVRERKALLNGDRVRIENQAAMMKAIIDKVTSPSIITNYNKLLKSLSGAFVTNLKDDNITRFIKKQAEDMSSWDILNFSLKGTDSYQYTYSYKGSKLYVMMPDMDSVNEVKEKLKEVLN